VSKHTHTPGPWLCCDGPENYQHRVYVMRDEVSGVAICDVVETSNARLIAAAPDLLEVAKHCENMLLRYEINRIDGEEISDRALELIRAAIAKATGAAIPEEGE
jgi:hypothetical protein